MKTNLSLGRKPRITKQPNCNKGHPNSLANLNQGGGPGPYAVFLSKLTPEEYAAHISERRQRALTQSMKQVMSETINQHGDKWTVLLEAALTSVMNKAIEQGDPAALNSVWDRVVGRPDTVMDVKVKQQDEVNDVLAKLQSTVLNEVETKQDKE